MGHVITDAELVDASRRGERRAYGQLIERHQRAVCAVALGATGNPALSEDLAQDTFIAAWGQLDQLRETSRLRAWLCGIARNLAKKARRQARREDLVDDVEVALAAAPSAAAPGPATPFEVTSQAQRDRVVWAALAAVPISYREVLVLFYQEGRSVREVAQALDLREDVVLQRLSRGRRHLADAVSDLVVSALERRPPPQQLVGRVLAALPPLGLGTATVGTGAGAGATAGSSSASVIATSRSTSSLSAGGTSMLKLSLIAFTLTSATVGGTYLATRADDPAPTASVSSAPGMASASTRPLLASPSLPVPSARAGTVTPPMVAPGPGPAPTPCESCEQAPDDDDDERLSAARIAEAGLHAGPSRGAADAPVTIAVFGDLQCTYCAQVLGTLDQLFDEYPGKLRLVLKQFPLPHHTQAGLAAEATVAAGAQGKFWEFHDLALAQQDDLGRDALIALAGQVGLDVARFTRELDNHVHAEVVARDLASADALAVRATPTFFINGQRFTGAQPIASFRAIIDAELAAPR
jgi:RNA polymerase sigma factor (sigma-70 family)